MSACLVYLPVKPEQPRAVEVSACQVRDYLEKLYGAYPITLDESNINDLRVMDTVDGELEGPWFRLIELIQQYSPHGIKIWEEN